MPEGITLASHVLQKWVDIIFKDCEEWLLAIWDNLLIMANTYDELYERLDQFLNICTKHNLRLKLAKTWFGQEEVDFFGYNCSYQKYELSSARKDGVTKIPFPNSLTQMKSFLGSAQFFASFMENFYKNTAILNDMTKKTFSWDKSTWTLPYEETFNKFKIDLLNAVAIYYPDYELPWILRTDASQLGVGCSLFMVHKNDNQIESYRPIGFISHKFSEPATKWSTIEQECFGCFYGVKSFNYLLRGKSFVLETDHRNLLWMEKSEVSKIIRWRIYMQGFDFLIKHIPGKLNNFPDFLSRCLASIPSFHSKSIQSVLHTISLLFSLSDNSTEKESQNSANNYAPTLALHNLQIENESNDTNQFELEDVLKDVHNARVGHFGITRTMQKLDNSYPGHKIPYKVVADYISRCSICQKERLGMTNHLAPIVRHLKPEHQRSTIGIDDLTITPADELGNKHLIVIVVHFTKLAWGYPCAECTADNVASALMIFFSIYGRFDTVMSDPGTAIVAKGVQQLNKYLGYKEHRISIVDRHTSNGVEGTNKQILRHIRALTMEERLTRFWSSPTVLPLIFFIINSNLNSETNMIPFHAHFGTADATYFQMPDNLNEEEQSHEFVKLLDINLRALTSASKTFQDSIIEERTRDTPIQTHNMYQPGDYVLWDEFPNNKMRSDKLTPKFRGPYEVIKHYKNDVTCRHVTLGHITDLDALRLKRFLGSKEEAVRLSMIDQKQFLITRILTYKGQESKRTRMQFLVLFDDGQEVWKYYDKDIANTQQFEDFCRANTQLLPLLQTVANATTYLKELKTQRITVIKPEDIVYVNLRFWNNDSAGIWYDQLKLPNLYKTEYVVQGKYKQFTNSLHKKIQIYFPVFDELFVVDNAFVIHYGHYKTIQLNTTIITQALVIKHKLLSNPLK